MGTKMIKTKKDVFRKIKLKSQLSLKTDYQKMNQYTGGMWLINDTEYHKNNRLQILDSPVEYQG